MLNPLLLLPYDNIQIWTKHRISQHSVSGAVVLCVKNTRITNVCNVDSVTLVVMGEGAKMVVVYEVYTQYIANARAVALRRAAAEGWSRATVTAVHPVGPDTYEVTLTVFQ